MKYIMQMMGNVKDVFDDYIKMQLCDKRASLTGTRPSNQRSEEESRGRGKVQPYEFDETFKNLNGRTNFDIFSGQTGTRVAAIAVIIGIWAE
jgi:hypothetical protein